MSDTPEQSWFEVIEGLRSLLTDSVIVKPVFLPCLRETLNWDDYDSFSEMYELPEKIFY